MPRPRLQLGLELTRTGLHVPPTRATGHLPTALPRQSPRTHHDDPGHEYPEVVPHSSLAQDLSVRSQKERHVHAQKTAPINATLDLRLLQHGHPLRHVPTAILPIPLFAYACPAHFSVITLPRSVFHSLAERTAFRSLFIDDGRLVVVPARQRPEFARPLTQTLEHRPRRAVPVLEPAINWHRPRLHIELRALPGPPRLRVRPARASFCWSTSPGCPARLMAHTGRQPIGPVRATATPPATFSAPISSPYRSNSSSRSALRSPRQCARRTGRSPRFVQQKPWFAVAGSRCRCDFEIPERRIPLEHG